MMARKYSCHAQVYTVWEFFKCMQINTHSYAETLNTHTNNNPTKQANDAQNLARKLHPSLTFSPIVAVNKETVLQ